MGELVQLPTAATSKVRQPAGRNARRYMESKGALPQFPAQPKFADTVLLDARAMMEADKTAAMQIALAVFSALPDRERLKVMGRLAGLAMQNHAGANGALAWVSYEMSDPSRRRQLFDAAAWLNESGGL